MEIFSPRGVEQVPTDMIRLWAVTCGLWAVGCSGSPSRIWCAVTDWRSVGRSRPWRDGTHQHIFRLEIDLQL